MIYYEHKKIVQKIVLGGVVIKHGKILILQRHKQEDIYPNMWELPSGKREPREISEEALIREVKEETGFDVEIIMPFSVFDYQIEKQEEINDSTQVNFLLKLKNNSQQIKLSPEHQSFAWITPGTLREYPVTDATRRAIEKAFTIASIFTQRK